MAVRVDEGYRTIAVLLKCKIVCTCDFSDRNQLKGFKINSH